MTRLLAITETDVSPANSLAASVYLLEAVAKGRTGGNPVLRIASPLGEALVLGRFQRARSALRLEQVAERAIPVLRRHSGGSTVRLAKGCLHVSLALPDRSDPIACEPRQFLQRYGAGLVRAITARSAKARYYGKDLLSIEDRPVGMISFELHPDGPALLEAILGVHTDWRPSKDLVGYPDRTKAETGGATSILEREIDSTEGLPGALAEAFGDLLGLPVEPHGFNPLETERIRSLEHRVSVDTHEDPPRALYLRRYDSKPVEEAIGFVEASVRLTQGRFLRQAWIHGDFMADSASITALEERLKMVPVKRRPVALVIDDVLGAPDHVIMGIRRLGSILEAVLDAAKRASEAAQIGDREQ